MSLGYLHISPVTGLFTQENIILIHIIAVLKQLNQIYSSLPPQQAHNWSKSPWQEPLTCKNVSSSTLLMCGHESWL